MTWDVPVADNCPVCGKTMFRQGRGPRKPFCANPECTNFLPEDQRGYKKKTKDSKEKDGAKTKKAPGKGTRSRKKADK